MNIEELSNEVLTAAVQSGMEVIQTQSLPARDGRNGPVPAELDPKLYKALSDGFPNGLYSHQSNAIQAVLDGEDICLATPTASGKSLVFMAAAADLVLSSPRHRVLALYPIKALIQDQKEKWASMLEPLGLSVGYIDGSVDGALRATILERNEIILMTPDVVHAWLMGNLGKREVSTFVQNLKYLILDEAHTYSGVFGSNMAYLIRRLMAVSGIERVISSTATIGDPLDFVTKLTGRQPLVFDEHSDTSPTPDREIFLTNAAAGNFKELTQFIVELSKRDIGKFIAFGDSRRLVETFVAATRRASESTADSEEEIEEEIATFEVPSDPSILPYRAGYEEEDRRQIQESLGRGELKGVVATSGLELGIDIGEVNTVVLLGTPPSIQSFRQRLGRVGRKQPGVCVLVDTKGLVSSLDGGLGEYLQREPEGAWLYLDNRYIQYTNALCAALEMQTAEHFDPAPFRSLPKRFVGLVENEVEPKENLPDDLFALKQRAQGGAHYEFPVRSGIERSYKVRQRKGPNLYPLGRLTESQMFREGYPGAVYYYMARPYRVYSVMSRTGEIDAKREKFYTTKPIAQNTVFPKFPGGVFQILKSDVGFVAEAELQVSERIMGFTEFRGNNRIAHIYEAGNEYRQSPIYRMFETTGVCWAVPGADVMSDALAAAVMEAFCLKFGIHSRDIGIGTFHTNVSPMGGPNCKGICIYDATNGSLRLTEQLAEDFGNVLVESIDLLKAHEPFDADLASKTAYLKECYSEMAPWSFTQRQQVPVPAEEGEWMEVFAIGEEILYKNGGQLKTMFINGYRYTPAGLMYQLSAGEDNPSTTTTRASEVLAGADDTKTVQYNLYTGDVRKV